MSTAEAAQKYWAFLSYSHADAAPAARLHRALEGYTLPRQVRRAHGLPRRLIPVFRDTEELAAASALTRRLQDALDQSRWLIVLCSPAAAASRYVNEEVEYFLKRHGPDRVLCVLLQGEPPGCFPPAIRALPSEPLAADLRSGAEFGLGVLRLIAAMAVVGFAELRNREGQRRRRRQLALAAGLAAVTLAALAAWDLFYREHVDYYGSYVRRHGIWEGIDQVSAGAVTRRANAWRFTRHGRLNPPDAVVFHKGCGSYEKPGMADVIGKTVDPDFTSRAFCQASFRYHAGGTIAQETLLGRRGQPLEALTYTEPGLAQFTEQGFAAANARSGIYYVQFERDARGFDTRVMFLQRRGVPRANDELAFGYAYSYDDDGRVLSRSVLDEQGAETGEITRYTHGPGGVVVEERHVDREGRPRNQREGYALQRIQVDAWGNPLSRRLFDAAGEPATDWLGLHERRSTWDEQGNEVELRFYDERGAPALNQAGIAGERRFFDERGFRTRVEFLGPDGQLAEDSEGEAALEIVSDAWGQNVENRIFDKEGKPAVWNNGVSIVRKQFDEQGNEIEQAFFGVDDKPVITTWGAVIRDRYDARGNIVEFALFDGEGRPYVRPDLLSAAIRRVLDEKGNPVEVTHLGADGQPTVSRWGWSISRLQWNDAGLSTRREYLDRDGRLVMTTEGFAAHEQAYDRGGNRISLRYLDAQNRPAKVDNGSTGWSAKYDLRTWMIEKTFLGADGRPVEVHGGYATEQYRRDAFGNIREEAYLDARGRPPRPPRAAKTLIEYDAHNRELLRRCLDAAGRPTNGPHAYATLKTERDRYGRVLAERSFDVRGRPVDIREQRWATHLVSYEGGKKEQYLDAGGKPVEPRMYRQ